MKNTDERFERLVTHAESMLCLPMEELRTKYADYPICIMKYIEKETNEDSIEVRFDNEEATILYLPDADSKNISVHLFFDSLENEDKFIEYLIEMSDYSFRQHRWTLNSCYLKVSETKESKIFCFYKLMRISS